MPARQRRRVLLHNILRDGLTTVGISNLLVLRKASPQGWRREEDVGRGSVALQETTR